MNQNKKYCIFTHAGKKYFDTLAEAEAVYNDCIDRGCFFVELSSVEYNAKKQKYYYRSTINFYHK